MLDRVRSFVKSGNLFLGYLSGMGILTMSLILFYEVISRYCFASPTIWVQEVSIYLFMWSMLAGASYTLMLGKHVRIDLLFDRLSPRVQNLLDAVTGSIGMIFCAIVTHQAYLMIASSLKYNKLSATILRVPMWVVQLPLFLGFLLLTLQFFLIVLDRIETAAGGSRKETEGGAA
ncbi:MAG: TRAP transporter small permease [Fretibacterium sp.]|nr:TRAP transporter small permease [Fretibacterium sp.]